MIKVSPKHEKSEFISNKEILKDAIRFCILMNENLLSALKLQKLLGLKKQTLYNYLNELVKENKVISIAKQHPHRSHLLVNYYSIPPENGSEKKVELMDSIPKMAKEINPKKGNSERLDENHLQPEISPKIMASIREHLDTQLNYSIAGILVIKKFLNSLTDPKFIYLLQHDFPNFRDNPEGFVFTHTEYSVLLNDIFTQFISSHSVVRGKT